jgi:rubrerythrin
MRLINADEALQLMEAEVSEALSKLRDGNLIHEVCKDFLEEYRERFIAIIEKCTEVNRAAKSKGRWFYFRGSILFEGHYTCSACGEMISKRMYKEENHDRCPHCGVDMEEAQNA